jgi:hypothetical protein
MRWFWTFMAWWGIGATVLLVLWCVVRMNIRRQQHEAWQTYIARQRRVNSQPPLVRDDNDDEWVW